MNPKKGHHPIQDFSPREFLKARRPEKFSDSVSEQKQTLDRSMLEYHLSTLTSRSQETDFERFARRLAEKEICPNLLPHTGPTGGGDSKVDTETYPVADALSLGWFAGIGREAATERWAFAFSAKKEWQEKLQSDIAKIAGTGRKYRKAFFITNQFVKDKFRGQVEDKLSKKYKLDVRVLDRSWILDKVFGNGHQSIAIEELRLSLPTSTNVRTGPLDLQKKGELDAVESRIKEATEQKRFGFQLVADCIEAAELARSLEFPRSDVDGRFLRAQRVANEYGGQHQQLAAAYQWAWTTYWWFEDYKGFSEQYGEVESLAKGSDNVHDLELLSNLWCGLQSSVRRGSLDASSAKLDARTEVLFGELERLKKEDDRPSSALQAETLRLLGDLMSCPPEKADPLLLQLKGIILRCTGLIGFPLETLVEVLTELGDYLGETPAYDELHHTIVQTVGKRSGEITAAQMLLRRGAQQLDADKPYEAIRSLGQALGKLYKHESRGEMIRALYLSGNAFERIGLLWAARGVVLIASSLATNELRSYSEISPMHAACYDKLRWLELQLGRLPQTLAWHEVYYAIKIALANQGYELKRFDSYEVNFDAIVGILILRADLWHLKHLTRLPQALENLDLIMSAEATCFALGHEDNLPKGLFPQGTSKEDVYRFFAKWRDQPAADDLPAAPNLYEGRKVTLSSVVLGCKATVETESASPCIDVAESVLAALENLLATSIQDHLIAREPTLTINVRKSDFAESPFACELKTREGRPHLEISCSTFNPHSMSLDEQSRMKDKLRDLLIGALARICYIEDVEKTILKLFKDEHALERAVNFATSFVALGNVLGHAPKTNIDAWIDPKAREYPLKREQEWDAEERQKQLTAKEEKAHKRLSMGTGKPPDGLFKMEGAKHTDMQVVSLIREPLWNEAKWSGTGFFLSPDDSQPPILALIFKNPKAAKEIFAHWRKELGQVDNDKKLRLAIIRGINKKMPHAYRVIVGVNPERAFSKSPTKYVMMMARTNTMEATTDRNLNGFLASYAKHGAYYFAHAFLQDSSGEPDLSMENYIGKRDLNIRNAWEIGLNDPDFVGIHEEDELIIPEGQENPPVKELLRWRQQKKQG